jgi:hypothetical protein
MKFLMEGGGRWFLCSRFRKNGLGRFLVHLQTHVRPTHARISLSHTSHYFISGRSCRNIRAVMSKYQVGHVEQS